MGIVFGICFLIFLAAVGFSYWNIIGLLTTDTLVDAADTALGEQPIRKTSDNLFAGLRKHIGLLIVAIISGLCSLVTGIIWLVQVLTG